MEGGLRNGVASSPQLDKSEPRSSAAVQFSTASQRILWGAARSLLLSKTSTATPRRASWIAVIRPDKPPPTTATFTRSVSWSFYPRRRSLFSRLVADFLAADAGFIHQSPLGDREDRHSLGVAAFSRRGLVLSAAGTRRGAARARLGR